MITILMTIVLLSPAMLMAIHWDKRGMQSHCILCKETKQREVNKAICVDCYSQLNNR